MFGLITTLTLLLTTALAAPTTTTTTHHTSDLQCRCLTFSTSAAPTHCPYQELLTLDWDAAFSLATANDLKIQFASDTTIAEILAIPTPVDSAILDAIQQGKTLPLDPAQQVRSENRMICGFEDDVDRVERCDNGMSVEVHYVGTVVGLFMLFFVCYLVAEYLWTVCFARTRGIRLEGEERALTVECDELMADQR
ncbi:hypothetical protein COCC4DRAFT_126395 [Bipolaris maydis ATCC 48331]|uniref:Uncharacterized protein n=2 Tax=Cochliobolus heterostrophus TaxID=5016 RepID=M2U7Z6_COCH5|nr:uncharacterized protein COCC4DRAFT_126395 [Bipolaris maydis ATCC 48331]EMD89861.1 hypothetical protein COCHEDRAFT_1106831 [Bipolaris maydis C5]KAJ5025445.1 hypothetical protein J3E73DRAFT_49656 [Bipolaris maydis]ENI09927.1 hypothetical protein COCC4DRAFT_126395 [Bipolaris maydis ATCC 48331]KAJ5064046.1 hypothetical protein J3E74DRAFT_23991 [Bipolaris maydis]KAJ6207697.1 hypothetical protein PSV09DRAFT_1106831 [Bipolaris maydis]